MSKNVCGIPVIEAEPDFICFLCGKQDETRPYGPNGEEVCFACAMKPENKRAAEINLRVKLFGMNRVDAEREVDAETEGK